MESNVESKVSMPYFKFENFNDQCFEFDTFHSQISVIILRKTKALQKEAQDERVCIFRGEKVSKTWK